MADECERSGLEYGKGRAQGIRETLRELGPAIREAREALQEAIHTHEVQMEMFPPNEVGHGVVRGSWLNTPDKLRSALAKLGGASC